MQKQALETFDVLEEHWDTQGGRSGWFVFFAARYDSQNIEAAAAEREICRRQGSDVHCCVEYADVEVVMAVYRRRNHASGGGNCYPLFDYCYKGRDINNYCVELDSEARYRIVEQDRCKQKRVFHNERVLARRPETLKMVNMSGYLQTRCLLCQIGCLIHADI